MSSDRIKETDRKPSTHKPEQRQERAELGRKSDARAKIVEDLVSKKYPISPEKRRDQSGDLHFRDDKSFHDEMKRREPQANERDIKDTLGFHDPRDGRAFVRDSHNTLEKATHEKIHQKSKSHMDTSLKEGFTEYFTKETAGPMGQVRDYDRHGREIKRAECYGKERDIASRMDAVADRKTINDAYFHGKTESLRGEVDAAFGKGSFDEINKAMKAGNYEEAKKITERYRRR
jgi:hypothetical protein